MSAPDRSAVLARLKAEPGLSGLRRSLDFYYGDAGREASMDAFYGRFVRPGDLVFDVGSHVGDHIACFRRLGARVVALEPQPACMRVLEALYGDEEDVTLVHAACGAEPGTLEMHINSDNPTVSTASPHFIAAATGADGWDGQRWDGRIEVPSTTMDLLIERYGAPAFAKIDVEGFEDQVLAGLSRPLPVLSFEFTTIERDLAARCLHRGTELGFDGFTLSLGDERQFLVPDWVSADELGERLRALPHEANSGDVYCRRG
ncbi:FkbM family methyltransferase [Actinoplanes sp. NPDC049316]|uniref:FkbM family methyltransferase n=1 Tax=Actinoplanes sp. NPDC049316 TaxID=3154727 RepID=UPI003445FC68